MKLLSINIALPREVEINGKPVSTGIYKEPVNRSVWLGKLTLEGDGVADPTVHGGVDQAAYGYPIEHYEHWRQFLQRTEPFPYGMFGENFTVEGMLEDEVCVGDIYSIGPEAVVQVTMARIPCFKFGHKIAKPDILKEFLHSGRSGFYLRVLKEGHVEAMDEIKLLERDPQGISVRTSLGMQKLGEGDEPLVRRALKIQSLCGVLRDALEMRLRKVPA